MKAGPWTDYREACANWPTFITIPAIDGTLPVALERRNGSVRILYERPASEREPLPVAYGIVEYAWDGAA